QPTADKHDGKMISPRSGLEYKLAEIWAELLDIDQIAMDQDVIALGMDSLAMMQMILRVEERFGVQLSFEDIFDAPTAAALALRLKSSKKRSDDLLQSSSNQPPATACVKGEG